ncbi:uncharacterized protein [Venturia canescens]|uniref:uncharacterized protein n=1 Tax=Venturia canescens TaxID=32260 RepID=UPI001C9BDBEF|nr:uncharacterized protein LOC122412100 [Venturia canescens]XP_043277357.1 uncharacterized protein LOC122412100 [Venturia canescens]XP_043277358.1 uncharacterized protein LOC122412100 [Venturia canescens]XP_043277359.1 uncharacterized protein LOC122412100 [Venturia canescens]
MASLALEEKINKIRLRNEEIKRRYEEVEADKKNAAKLDALAKPILQEDWPTRKEPPEFSGPVKQNSKPKQSIRRHNDQPPHHYIGTGEGKKNHTFADGQGPPPDPKYNFLADSEREEPGNETSVDSDRNRGRNKTTRGGFKRRGSGRDWHAKEHWNQHEPSGNTSHPDYEAWRAERNRIDEARISRQRTAEGNWRREWDNDKFHLADDVTKRENRISLGDVALRQEYNENDKHYRSPRTTSRISHQSNSRESHQVSSWSESKKNHSGGAENEKRVVIASEKSIKILLNPQGPMASKSSVMSVKVSSPNIAGTGRVGPRQRPRVMYSSQLEHVDSSHVNEGPSIGRQKPNDENTKVRNFEAHKILSPKNVHERRGKSDGKNSSSGKKEEFEGTPKSVRKDSQKSPHAQKRVNIVNHSTKFSRDLQKPEESLKKDSTTFLRTQKTKDTGNNSKISRDLTTNANSIESEKLNLLEEMDSNNETNDEQIRETTPEHKNNEAQQENSTSLKDESCEQIFGNVPSENSGSHENVKSLNAIPDIGTCNHSADVNESSEAISCMNSGDISTDSGFIEMPSNSSIHDLSDNFAIKMNDKIDNDCPQLLPSTSEASKNSSSIEGNETESQSVYKGNLDDGSLSNDTTTLPNDMHSTISCDSANSCEDKDKNENGEVCEVQSKENANSTDEKIAEIPRDPNVSKNLGGDETQNIQENSSTDMKEEILDESLT